MLIQRQLRFALTYRYTGRTVLCVTGNGMIGQGWKRIAEKLFNLITVQSRLHNDLLMDSLGLLCGGSTFGNSWGPNLVEVENLLMQNETDLKAHYMLALALLQRKEYSEGVKELEKALDLGRGANPHGYMVEEIWQELAKAKYLQWEDESTKRSWELQNLKEACEAALRQKHLLVSTDIEGFLDETKNANSEQFEALATEIEGVLDETAKVNSEQLEALDRIFSRAAEDDIPAEVPDYLCCKITLDIFRDPVIVPSGVTYERAVIVDHLQKVGNFDPITREPLYQSQLVPNLAIKEAVQAFLDKHGWAYKID